MSRLVVDNNLFFAGVLDAFREGKDVTIPVKGNSMLPFIKPGRDTVVLEPVEECTPQGEERKTVGKGDIVLFRYRGAYILHRVLWVKDGEVEIQGDGVLSKTEHCRTSEVYGRVKTILKKGEIPVDPYSPVNLRRLKVWNFLYPLRRYILGVYRRLPWNRYLMHQ